ncbi:hypothetical protein BHE74_00052625 [Ensete ventricosum]|nr:hypothetical protein BHE74_00052625 [Ensete ventricosum]
MIILDLRGVFEFLPPRPHFLTEEDRRRNFVGRFHLLPELLNGRDLSEARKQLKEARVRARKADDDLLKSVKELESARAELPKRAIDDYKGSAGFKEGLKRIG